ncbi:DNA-binding protein [Acinetobacter brisouii]|uniref:DNA-binding protein n=1 Tax=Acinetobacter brisouii TaxID=396323 RepID=UPI00124FE20D|nr:DNA-binding protein [Acinetobacter brisouii]
MTPEEVKAKFHQEGKTFTDWAKEHGYRRADVYRVLNGLCKAKRGLGHEIAVKLGLKDPQ